MISLDKIREDLLDCWFVEYFFETVYSPPFLAPFFCLCLHSEAFFLFWGLWRLTWPDFYNWLSFH